MPDGGNLALIAAVQNPLSLYEKGVNTSWRGAVQTRTGVLVPAIIKDLDGRQLANELIAHTLCRIIGLPTPDVYVVVNDGSLPQAVKGPMASGDLCGQLGIAEGRLMFASATCGNSFASAFSMPRRGQVPANLFDGIRAEAIGAMRKFLVEWPLLGVVAAFDEWAAVIDRHEGNLLVDEHDKVWLIDHGHAFTGANWRPPDLRQISFGNCLVSEAVQELPPVHLIKQVNVGAKSLEAELAANDNGLSGVNAAVRELDLLPEEDICALKEFLTERRKYLQILLEQSISEASRRVGIV